jgi:4'-phosphopantetheinyl transferase
MEAQGPRRVAFLSHICPMSSFKLPRAVSWPLTIQRGEAQLSAALAVVFDDESLVWNELARELLGPTEFAYFSTLPSGRRRQGYLLGRYAAKVALVDLLQESDLRIIEIGRGVFDQPIVLYAQKQGWGVTVSHADSLAFALAFPMGHPMGIDAERIDSTSFEAILSQLSKREIGWIETANVKDKPELATALWTSKEALSKILCTGLTSPMQIYSLAEFNLIRSGTWEGLFQNFGQYKAIASVGSSYVLSIVLPRRSVLGGVCDIGEIL